MEACFFTTEKEKQSYFKRVKKQELSVEKYDDIYVITLSYDEKKLNKLRIKKLRLLDNKLAQFSGGVYFSDFFIPKLSQFTERLKKPDGHITFYKNVPDIVTAQLKQQGKDIAQARIVFIGAINNTALIKTLCEKFRFIYSTQADAELWDNIYEETGLTVAQATSAVIKNADVVIYPEDITEIYRTKGISVGFNAEGHNTIQKNNVKFIVDKKYEILEKIMQRALDIGEIEALNCTYKYYLSM